MNVTLLAHTPNPERLVATAARLCYSADDVEIIMDGMCDNDAEKQIKLLQSIGHESPIEHVSFTFAIEGVSRSLLAQITRHRLASFSVRSQRYVSMSNSDYVTPDAIESDTLIDSLYDAFMKTSNDIYKQISDRLQLKYIENGMDPKSATKKAIEDARYVLPNATTTAMIVTMNARELMHFFRLRCCNRAQWEIREVADEMLRLCQEVAPTLFDGAGAPCVSGNCPEGRMSCGKPRKA
mgnify:CR=1 FL=1